MKNENSIPVTASGSACTSACHAGEVGRRAALSDPKINVAAHELGPLSPRMELWKPCSAPILSSTSTTSAPLQDKIHNCARVMSRANKGRGSISKYSEAGTC